MLYDAFCTHSKLERDMHGQSLEELLLIEIFLYRLTSILVRWHTTTPVTIVA